MKIDKNKKILAVILALSALAVMIVSVHGCSVATYGEKKLASISITPGNATIAAGTVQQFKATGHYSDSTTADLSSSVTWSTLDASVATIDAASGLATAVISAGTCTITASAQGLAGTTMITIKDLPLLSITVTGSTSMSKGLPQQFTASGLFSNGTDTISAQDITTLVSWNSSTPAVATVGSNSGSVTGVAAGTTDISATITTVAWGTVTSAPLTVTVSNGVLQSIAITGPIVKKGMTYQFTATGTFVDSITLIETTENMTSQVVWTSLTPNLATVNNTGLVTGVVPGYATINAVAGGITGTITFIVYQGSGT